MKKKLFVLMIFSCVIFNSFAQETKFNLFGSKEVFALSPVIDASILGTGVSLFVTDFILEKTIKQSSSNLQNKVFNKDELSKLDKLFINPYSKTLDNLGTVGSFALLASPLLLLTEPKEEWFTIGTMYVETVLLAYSLKDFGKVLVNKPRPYMYNNTYPQKEIENGDWNKSFPSGHTTLAFTGAAYTSYVFSKYNPSSSLRQYEAAGLSVLYVAGILRRNAVFLKKSLCTFFFFMRRKESWHVLSYLLQKL